MSTITGETSQIKLILHPFYRENEANTRETVAVMVRPYRLAEGSVSRGAHWHVEVKMEYASPKGNENKIDWVRVNYPNGSKEEFIASSQVAVSSDVEPEIEHVLATEKVHQVTCITCHNRVGHEFPTPDEAVDNAMAAGKISQALPYIKREAVEVLGKRYRSTGEADKAIEGIRGMYAAKYPLVSRTRAQEVNGAVDELKEIYPLVADPEMDEISADYPNDLGHQNGPGCLRCHDGAHFEVGPGGHLLTKTIPWECTTCHTFPQVGKKVTSIACSPRPPTTCRTSGFSNTRTTLRRSNRPPQRTSTFCANCHGSGVAKVEHEEMLYHHPQVIEKAGLQECFYCHQKAFCARCHKPVLGSSEFGIQGESKVLPDA